MPTLEGIIFIPLAFFFFFKRPDLLFPLLIVSTVFQASSIISSGPIGIQPYYCVALAFVVRFLLFGRRVKHRRTKIFGFSKLWVVFAGVSIASAIALPIVFKGIPVFDPKLGIDDNFVTGPSPLRFQTGNLVQSGFLILNILVVIAATSSGLSIKGAHKMFLFCSNLIVFIVVIQDLFFWTGIPFPTQLLNNNPSYGVVPLSMNSPRATGSFSEPSMAGAVLAAMVGALLWRYFAGRTTLFKTGFAMVALLLVASASSLLAVVIVCIVLIAANPILRFPWFIRVAKLRRASGFLVAAIMLASLMIIPSFRALVLSQTIEKGASNSALVRFGADLYAFKLTTETFGLGVGLGSNRPSSFVASLLSQVGIAGFLLFCCAAWRTTSRLREQDGWIRTAAFGLLLSMVLGEPDLSFPFLWILFALAAQSQCAAVREAEFNAHLPCLYEDANI